MPFHTRIILGLVLGALTGTFINLFFGDSDWVQWINHYLTGPAGQLFLRGLMMVVVPLVFATLSLGISRLGNLSEIGRIGARTLAYFLVTTTLAVTIGLILVNTVRPGDGIPAEVSAELVELYGSETTQRSNDGAAKGIGIETLIEIVPRNPVRAAADMQMLPLIFFSVMFGVALTLIAAHRAAPMIGFLEALSDIVIKLIELIMKLAPYGVFALVFVVTSRFGWELLGHLGLYAGVVFVGLLLHCLITLSMMIRFGAGISPRIFWARIREAIVTAFSTSSSNATLPTSLVVAKHNLGLPDPIAGFVLPLGATINMNGTALFEGVTVLFVAQAFNIDLSLGQQVIVVIASVVTAVGAAGVPGGSIPLLMVMATAVGVPGEGIAIILGIDRILDMARTTVNVCGDLTAACVVARWEGKWDAGSLQRAISTPDAFSSGSQLNGAGNYS